MQNGWRFVLGRSFARYGLVSSIEDGDHLC
jgi:hypothetical protein